MDLGLLNGALGVFPTSSTKLDLYFSSTEAAEDNAVIITDAEPTHFS